MTGVMFQLPKIAVTSIISLVFTTFVYSAPVLHPIDNRTDLVPFEKWHCGSSDWDKWLSHQMVEDSCPTRMYESNLCCIVHDICYTEEGKTQQECDETFCFCLTRTLVEAVPHHAERLPTRGCSAVSEFFCDAVQTFGSAAHSNAQKPSVGSTTPSPPPPTTTTIAFPWTSGSEQAEEQVKSPNRIGEFIAQNISLECYDDELSECIEGLHSCVYSLPNISSSAVIDYTECSRRFCSCISGRLPGEVGGEKAQCHAALEQVCHESGSVKLVKISAKGDSNDRVLLSAININYPSNSRSREVGNTQQGLSSWQWMGVAALFSTTFIASLYIAYKFFKLCKGRKMSHSLPMDTTSPGSHIRRHTLPVFHPYCEPHYKHFDEDQGCCFSHHQKHHLHLGVNFLHTHRPQGLQINSSKSHLLSSEGESSSGKLSSSSPGSSSTPSMISSPE